MINLSPGPDLFKDAAEFFQRPFRDELPGWQFSHRQRQQLAAARRLYLHSVLSAALDRAEAEVLRTRGVA